MVDLRRWLSQNTSRNRRAYKLLLKVGDEEEPLPLGAGKVNWVEVLRTIEARGATAVTCLDSNGEVLRSRKLTEDDGDGENAQDVSGAVIDKALARERRDMAAMLDAQGRAIERAYSAGARAAGVSQENLVGIVETLSGHLSIAITNIHTLSNAYANVIAQQQGGEAPDGDQSSKALMGLIGAVMGNHAAPVVENGKAKKP